MSQNRNRNRRRGPAPAVAVALEAPPPQPKQDGQVTLPSGKVAVVNRKPKGRDMVAASKLGAKTDMELSLALLAQIVTIDGRKVIYEELLDMDLDELAPLLDGLSGKL